MQVVDECRLVDSVSQNGGAGGMGPASMVHLSPSLRGESVLNVATVDDHQSFADLPQIGRSNSLGDEELLVNYSKKMHRL